ncbi:hypothetical protein [Dysgonomonas sp.]
MAYNNYNNSGGYGNYNRGGYGYNNYRNSGYSRGYGNRQPRKRSGAKIKMMDGNPVISAWRKNKSGFYSLYARPYKGTKDRSSKNGKNWMNLFVTITNRTTMQTHNCSGLFDVDRRRLYIKDLNMIVTEGGQGGYFGTHIRRRR